MISASIDTDVVIRLLSKDDEAKRAAATRLFASIESGEIEAELPTASLVDALFVLTSKRLYAMPRADAATAMQQLISLPGLHVADKPIVMEALAIFLSLSIDFGDAYVAAVAIARSGGVVYSFDRDYDRIPGVSRREP